MNPRDTTLSALTSNRNDFDIDQDDFDEADITGHAPIESQIFYEGSMTKKPINTLAIFTFQKKHMEKTRWFVLERYGMLSYYKSKEHYITNAGKKKGELIITAASKVLRHMLNPARFRITDGRKDLVLLRCEDADTADRWIAKFQSIIVQLQSVYSSQVPIEMFYPDGMGSTAESDTSEDPPSGVPALLSIAKGLIPNLSIDGHMRNCLPRLSTIKGDAVMWQGSVLTELGLKYFDVLIDRVGDMADSYMKIKDIPAEIQRDAYYTITPPTKGDTTNHSNLLTKVNSDSEIPKRSTDPTLSLLKVQPRYLEVGSWWNTRHLDRGAMECENPLELYGINSFLQVDVTSLIIPVHVATKENVAFFLCALLGPNEAFQFEMGAHTDSMPVAVVEVGAGYNETYIMRSPYKDMEGHHVVSGATLSWKDHSSLYVPLCETAGGCVVVGNRDPSGGLKIAAFSIPFGKALYVNPFIMHNDGYIVGEYGCVFGKTEVLATTTLLTSVGCNCNFELKNFN